MMYSYHKVAVLSIKLIQPYTKGQIINPYFLIIGNFFTFETIYFIFGGAVGWNVLSRIPE